MAIISANGEVIREAVLDCGKDNKTAIREGCQKAIKYLLDQEDSLLEYLKLDVTPPASEADWDRFYAMDQCAVCEQKFDWQKDKYARKYQEGLRQRGLLGQRKVCEVEDPDESDSESVENVNRIVHHHTWQTQSWRGPCHK